MAEYRPKELPVEPKAPPEPKPVEKPDRSVVMVPVELPAVMPDWYALAIEEIDQVFREYTHSQVAKIMGMAWTEDMLETFKRNMETGIERRDMLVNRLGTIVLEHSDAV